MTTEERGAALESIAAEVRACTRCRLAGGRTNAVPGEGSPDTEVVFVGEGPGQREDQQGRPFVGAAGKLLAELLASETKGDDAKRYVEEAIKDVREDREDVEEALADALEDYAGDLRSAGLLGAAARAQEKLWREHPSFRKPPELLLRAADRWARVYEAGAPARARALYEELLRDYPDSDQAERARRGLSGQAR